MKKINKQQQQYNKQVFKQFKQAEARVMKKIKARMTLLSKDEELRKQMETDIKEQFNNA